ncbi:MAG: hypothetical protein MJ252_01845 [archaeon]|nr:hypothetical protein [archaeon]
MENQPQSSANSNEGSGINTGDHSSGLQGNNTNIANEIPLDSSEEEYMVSDIIDKRKKRNGPVEYLVLYDQPVEGSLTDWYEVKDLDGAMETIHEYEIRILEARMKENIMSDKDYHQLKGQMKVHKVLYMLDGDDGQRYSMVCYSLCDSKEFEFNLIKTSLVGRDFPFQCGQYLNNHAQKIKRNNQAQEE